MICPNCKLVVPDSESPHHICPNYGVVQHLIDSESLPTTQPAQRHTKSQAWLHSIKSAITSAQFTVKNGYLLAGIGVLLLVTVSLGFGFYQNSQASGLLYQAKTNISKGQFAKAKAELYSADQYFALNGVKNDIKTTQSKNLIWINQQKKLDEATVLVKQDKLDEAKNLLAQIDKKFPVYNKVIDLQKEIARKKAIADAAALKAKLEAEAKAKAEAAAKAAKKAPPKESVFKQPAVASTGGCYQIGGIPGRSASDRPDDTGGPQMHIVYALPSDGADQSYDTNGRIASSVSAFENWLCSQTGGRALRLDTYQGKLDVSFIRFSSSDNAIRTGATLPYSTDPNHNPYVREDIEIRLNQAGLNQSNKIYLVYYDGSSNYSCGGASWPPSVAGHSAAMYLKGDGCTGNQLSSSMGYWEFAMLHDSLHTLGAVATCAPHHTLSGHVSDGNNDLMYSGSQPWYPSVLDNGHDDYYGHNNTGCFDLAKSPFLSS